MKTKYVYNSGAPEETIITYDDVDGTILLHKDTEKADILVKKHSIYLVRDGVRLAKIKSNKAENMVKTLYKNIIKTGLKTGTCKEYEKGE